MTRTFIRTTALTLSMAASMALAGNALAAGYLEQSPYQQRRQDQRSRTALDPMPTQDGIYIPQSLNLPNNTPPQPLDMPNTASSSGVLVPPPSASSGRSRTLLNTAPSKLLMPSKPLYPARSLNASQTRSMNLPQKVMPAPSKVIPTPSKPLALPGSLSAQPPIAPAFNKAAPAKAQANIPSRLPLPTEIPSGEMPTFKPYATLETQKEVPIDSSVFNMPERAIPRPLPVRDPQLAPLAVDNAPTPPTAPSQPLPVLDALDIPEPVAPKAVAAPIIEPSAPPSKLTEESKRILSKIPKNMDTPKKEHKHNVRVNRIDPDVQGILDAKPSDDDNVQTHESVGVKIQVRQPKFNSDYELEKAYNALISGQTEIAIDIYKGILKQAPSNQPALFGLATTYHRIGNLDNARPLYGKLISINPNHREALNNFLVLVSEESPEDALRQLEELEAKNPDFSPIPAQMALLLDKMGSPEAARKKMIRAVSLSPDNIAYKYNLAVMMDEQQKYGDAAALYKQLIQAGNRGEKLPADINDLQERLTFIVSNKL